MKEILDKARNRTELKFVQTQNSEKIQKPKQTPKKFWTKPKSNIIVWTEPDIEKIQKQIFDRPHHVKYLRSLHDFILHSSGVLKNMLLMIVLWKILLHMNM